MKSNDKNNYRVNWIDGMKINKNHFIDFENSVLEIVKQSERKDCNPTNFGLLPEYSEAGSSIDVTISVDGQESIEVVLNSCRAIIK